MNRRDGWMWVGRLVLGMAVILTAGVGRAGAADPAFAVPERTRVCMVQDTVMAVPVERDGKTYYGCCEMCKGKIEADPERYTKARDPVSGAVVDKATAALLSVGGRVLYFESEGTRESYTARLAGPP